MLPVSIVVAGYMRCHEKHTSLKVEGLFITLAEHENHTLNLGNGGEPLGALGRAPGPPICALGRLAAPAVPIPTATQRARRRVLNSFQFFSQPKN